MRVCARACGRAGVRALGLHYGAGVARDTLVFAPGHAPPAGQTRPKSARRQRHVVSVADVALALPSGAWHRITWRAGTAGPLTGRFVRVRVVSAQRHRTLPERAPEWLLIEWPEDEVEPTRYWLSTLPEKTGLERLVEVIKLRWRIERDYQDLKQDLNLDHFEDRSWRGFHHHASLCIVAYGFLITEREALPPSGPRRPGPGPCPGLPRGRRPRGTPVEARAARADLDPLAQATPHPRPRPHPATMPVLLQADTHHATALVTQ